MHSLHSLFFSMLGVALILNLPVHALPGAPNPCLVASSPLSTCPKPGAFKFAVLGDSWASGVSYNAATEYDKGGKCRRSTESHGVQMKNDVSWAGSNIYFDFPACSASKMLDIVSKDGVNGKCQVCQLKDSDVLIMTIGGNDASFFSVVDSCLYHSDNRTKDWGPDYNKDPNREGVCAIAIDNSRTYIERRLTDDLQVMYNALLKSGVAKSNPMMRIYQTGYVHFFNDDAGNTWCNNWPFWLFNRPHMSLYLRTDINDLITRGNRVVKDFITSLKNKNIGYISITEVFNGHRFCEPRHNIVNQFTSDDVWLWNLSLSADELAKLIQDRLNPPKDQKPVPWDGPPLWDFSDAGDSKDGSRTRPFHPKISGFKAIKGAIIKKLKDDKVPGITS